MMDAAMQAAIDQLEAREPHLAGAFTVELLHDHRRRVGEEMTGTYEELRHESLHRALLAAGMDDRDTAVWMADRLMAARAEVVSVHDDVEPAVRALLDAGHLVCAITNGNFPFQRLDLARHFAFVVHAEAVGEFKPDPGPFAQAVELAGRRPPAWVHVGDDPLDDITGAQAFGMRAVWLNRFDAVLPDDVRPDAEISSLAELPAVTERLLAT